MRVRVTLLAAAIFVAAGVAIAANPQPASAYYETTSSPAAVTDCYCHGIGMPNPADPVTRKTCQHCHGYTSDNFPLPYYDSVDVFEGPHGNYSPGTRKCSSCHTSHDASGIKLLAEQTIVGTCLTCHDGTGGFGVYGAIKARTGLDPATNRSLGSHRIDATNLIPGGDGATGDSATRVFKGPGGRLICTDCHNVHGRNVVAPFMGERKRTRSRELQDRPTSKLLRQKPSGAATSVAEYGSDWCAACHSGRASGSMVMNHPVDSLATTSTPFVYRRVASNRTLGIFAVANRHVRTDRYDFGLGNTDYLIPQPRTAAQGGHAPICQQCHEDSRQAGTLSVTGSAVVSAAVHASADGVDVNANPRFQNFPHETQNSSLLLETGDGLCLNCHVPSKLP